MVKAILPRLPDFAFPPHVNSRGGHSHKDCRTIRDRDQDF